MKPTTTSTQLRATARAAEDYARRAGWHPPPGCSVRSWFLHVDRIYAHQKRCELAADIIDGRPVMLVPVEP